VGVGIEVPADDSGGLWVCFYVEYVLQGLSVVFVVVNIDGSEGARPKVNVESQDVVARGQV
jgi:hypothetical protein